jgi:hypothetical protein
MSLRLLILIAILLCWLNFNTAVALAPVILTSDQTTKLDLTNNEAKSVNLLDCHLHVEGHAPNFKLVHSNGELPIPLLAVKSIQDDAFVEIAVQGSLVGQPVNRIFLHYAKNPTEYLEYSRTAPSRNVNNGKSFPQASIFFLIQGEEARVALALKQQIGKEEVYIEPNEIQDERVIVLFSNQNIENTGGYGIKSWFGIHQTTQVEYECVF